MDNVGESLVRIEGKIDLINAQQTRSTDDIKDLRERAHSHSNRLGILEAKSHFASGALKLIQILASLGGAAGLIAFLKFVILTR